MARLLVELDYIPVTVRGNTIKCPDAVKKGSKNHDSKLEWRMETAGFAITDIVFKSAEGKAEFNDGNKTAGGGFKVTDEMSEENADKNHDYQIMVEEIGGTKKLDLDPMIRNEP
jgi:hypothetical protein